MSRNGHAATSPDDPALEPLLVDEAAAVDPSGWFAVELRYTYLLGTDEVPYLWRIA